jgi:hypothetical protein
VGAMDRSRGYELYPHHHRRHLRRLRELLDCCSDEQRHPESSAHDDIVCERFVMGAPEVCDDAQVDDDYYSSEWGRVFYERNSWPPEDPEPRLALCALWSPMYK